MKRFQQLISKYQKTIQVLLAISFFILLPIACKKEAVKEPTFCDQHPDQCAPISEAKDFFLFKMGSWWVYEEETSKVRDSVYVTQYSNTETYDFDARYTSVLTGYTYHFFPFGHSYSFGSQDCDPVKPIKNRCITINRSKYKPGNFIAEDACFFYNCNLNDSLYTMNLNVENNQIKIILKNNNFNLLNYSFGKTIKIFEKGTSIENNQPTNHYFSKGVGLIRKELLDSNQVWNLVNYHIEP